MEKEKQRIYQDTLELFTDNGEYLIMDKEFSDSVGFIKGVKGYRIPKNYLSEKIRWQCVKRLSEKDFQESGESIYPYMEIQTRKILKEFEIELKGFHLMNNSDKRYYKMNIPFDDLIREFISYVLKSELYIEIVRIRDVLQDVDERFEDADDETYWKWLIHEIDYPGETEEEWKAREEREQKFSDIIKGMTSEELDKMIEENRKQKESEESDN